MNKSKLGLIQEYGESNRATSYRNELIRKVNNRLDQKNEQLTKLPKSEAGCTLKKGKFVAKTACKVRWTKVVRTRLLKS